MSLDTSIAGWLDELNHAEAALKPHLETLREDKLRYQGLSYKSGEGRGDPHNHALMWFSLMRSQLLIGNPRVRWTSDLEGDPATRALALTHACNQVSKRLRLRDLNEQLLMDFGFKSAVCLITSAPAPGYQNSTDGKMWPAAYRISPEHFRYDVAAVRPEARAWQAHLVITSRKSLRAKAEAKKGHWRLDALEKAQSDVKRWRGEGKSIPDRDEIAYWEIWVPGEGKNEDGYNGRIYTVIDQQSDPEPIRDPFDYFGPPWGPYQCGGDMLVPDESFPLGPITASSQQAAYLNRIKRATARAIENYKQFTIVRGSKLAELIQNSNDQWVYGFDEPDIRSAVVQMVHGGATDQHFVAEENATRTLDEISGITDLMKGNVNPDNKATADALAAQASGVRTSGTVSKFHDLVTRVMYSIGYMIDRDSDIEIELGPQAKGLFVDSNGKPTTRLKGGLEKGQDPEEFFGLDLDLQVGSMERSLEADTAYRMAVRDQFMERVATFGPSTALFFDWAQYAQDVEEDTGVRGLTELVDPVMLTQYAGLMIQQQGAEQPKGQTNPTPRLSGSGNGNASRMAAKAGPGLTGAPGKPMDAAASSTGAAA